MTSKLDTAGLVERLRNAALHSKPNAAALMQDAAKALASQAAAPDMQPVAWLGTNLDGESEAFLSEHQAAFWSNGACNAEPLVLQSAAAAQLSALQERAERAYNDGYAARDEVVRACRERIEAAEARVAELDALIEKIERLISYPVDTSIDPRGYSTFGGGDRLDYAMELIRARAALAHKGEEQLSRPPAPCLSARQRQDDHSGPFFKGSVFEQERLSPQRKSPPPSASLWRVMEMREKIARALAPYMAVFPLEPDLSDAEAMWDARTPTEDQAARRAVQAVLTAIGETHVLVPNKPQAWWRPVVVGDNFRFEVTFDTPSGTNWRPLYAAAKEGE